MQEGHCREPLFPQPGLSIVNMPILLTFIFGTIIGSFLNVIAYRYNSGRTIGGRSACGTCGKHLAWYELIPLLSFVLLEAKCRKCKTHISWQYPLVELTTGLVFVSLYIKFQYVVAQGSVSGMLFGWILFSLLMVIAVYDLRHKIIPDGMVYFFSLLAFVGLFYSFSSGVFALPTLWQVLAGPVIALPFFLLWVVSGGKWIGLGDAKLALGIGFLLGLWQGIAAILLSFWIGGAISVVLIVLGRTGRFLGKRGLAPGSEVPFAPFMVLGTLIVFVFGVDIFTIASWFQF